MPNKREKGSAESYWPPPPRPVDDADAAALRKLAIYCKRSLTEKNRPKEPSETKEQSQQFIRILGLYRSKKKDLAWATYHSHSLEEWMQKREGDLTYFKGDIVQVLQTQGAWILGACRGRLGITPADHLTRDGFVRVLHKFDPTQDDEIAIKVGQVIPAAPSSEVGWLVAYTPDEEGLIPANYVEPATTLSNEHKPEHYQYGPLKSDEIRLIRISQADVTAKTACNDDTSFFSLITVRLNEAPAFTALSYCWGDEARYNTAFCEGKPLKVSWNLATLLKWFPISKTYTLIERIVDPNEANQNPRLQDDAVAMVERPPYPLDQDLYLWADAICINQNDMAEKVHQIPLMRDIYGKARDVRVYLGESEDVWKVLLCAGAMKQLANVEYQMQVPADLEAHMAKIDIGTLSRLFLNPAFQRSWMIQEMVLGKEVSLWFGQADLNLGIIQAYIHFQSSHNLLLADFEGVNFTPEEYKIQQIGMYNAHKLGQVKFHWDNGKPKNFIEVLSLFRGSKARDPRDKVYSLLSISSDHYRRNVVPDYTDATTVPALFIQVANLAVASSSDLDAKALLEHSGAFDNASEYTDKLPSWIPDWTAFGRPPFKTNLYRSSGATSVSVRLGNPNDSPKSTSIIVKGYVVDYVACTGPKWRYDNSEQPLPEYPEAKGTFQASVCVHETIYLLCEKLLEAGLPYPNPNTTYEDAVWQSLVCGQGWGERRARPEDKQFYQAFRRKLGIDPKLDTDGIVDEHPFFTVLSEMMPGRRWGVTKNRYVGMFPNGTEYMDFVFILQGFETPFVLRAVDEGDEREGLRFKLIGPCYVHGIMDGELTRVEKKDGVEIVLVKGHVMDDIEIF